MSKYFYSTLYIYTKYRKLTLSRSVFLTHNLQDSSTLIKAA